MELKIGYCRALPVPIQASLSGIVTFFQLNEDLIQKQYSNAVKRQ